MGFHYVFLVGLALWDATVTAKKTETMAATAAQFQGESVLDSAGTQGIMEYIYIREEVIRSGQRLKLCYA